MRRLSTEDGMGGRTGNQSGETSAPNPVTPTLPPPPSGKMVLSALNPREYEHDLDRKALDALQNVKGLDFLIRKYNEHVDERIWRLINTGSNIRVTEQAFPELWGVYE